jgi:hypothetical protein
MFEFEREMTMHRESSLFPEFAELAGKVYFVVQVSQNEACSSCPACGGTEHQDGSWPDRFRMFRKSKATGEACGWCRRCSFKFFPGRNKDYKPDPATQAAWEQERRAIEERRLMEVQHALSLLQTERLWLDYHAALTDEARVLYRQRGITDPYWLGYWELGYCDSFQVNYKDGETWMQYQSDTLTIPIFEENGGRAVSLRHRLLHPQRSQDRYRPGMKGLPAAPFICDRDRKLAGKLLIVEGEFKSMVSYICLDDPSLHVIGLPGKSPDLDTLAKFANCEPIYLLLDPDAYVLTQAEIQKGARRTAAQRLTDALQPERVRWLNLPDKVDDLINAGVVDRDCLRGMMRTARKAW